MLDEIQELREPKGVASGGVTLCLYFGLTIISLFIKGEKKANILLMEKLMEGGYYSSCGPQNIKKQKSLLPET